MSTTMDDSRRKYLTSKLFAQSRMLRFDPRQKLSREQSQHLSLLADSQSDDPDDKTRGNDFVLG